MSARFELWAKGRGVVQHQEVTRQRVLGLIQKLEAEGVCTSERAVARLRASFDCKEMVLGKAAAIMSDRLEGSCLSFGVGKPACYITHAQAGFKQRFIVSAPVAGSTPARTASR